MLEMNYQDESYCGINVEKEYYLLFMEKEDWDQVRE